MEMSSAEGSEFAKLVLLIGGFNARGGQRADGTGKSIPSNGVMYSIFVR